MMLRNKLAVPLHSQLALTIGEQALGEWSPICIRSTNLRL
jgi:hypothetical protein